MSTNNICFNTENKKEIASTLLNTPSFSSLLIFLVSVPLGRYFAIFTIFYKYF